MHILKYIVHKIQSGCMTEHSQCLYIHKLTKKDIIYITWSVAFILYTYTVHWRGDSLGTLQDLTPLQILRLIVSKDAHQVRRNS